MKNILLLFLLFATSLVYSQTTSRRFSTGKVIHTQTGAGAGYYDVSCNFVDEGGLFDGTTVTTGDYLFVSDGGYGYYLPVISVLSSGYSTVSVRVDNTGLPLGSVPVGVGYISKGSDHFKFFPFVSGISNANQQISIEETLSSIDSILQYKLPERTSGSSAPAYTPTSSDSWLAQNGAGSLYFYNGSSWTLVGTGGSSISEQVCLDTVVITGITPTCVVGTPMIRKVLSTWDNISGHVVTDIPTGVVIKLIGTDTAVVAYCGNYPTLLTAGSYYADSITTSGYTTTPTGSVIRPVFIVDANNYLKVNTGFGFTTGGGSGTIYTNSPLAGDGSSGDPVRIDDLTIGIESYMYWDGSQWTDSAIQTDGTLDGNGTSSTPLKIAQQSATTGQLLGWSGTSWVPTTVSGTTNLTFTGSGPYTLNSSTGTDVTITQGTGMSLVRTSNDLTVNLANTAVTPGTYGVAGYPSFMVDAQGRITSAIDNALPDGSNGNEGILGVSAGSTLNSIITSNTITASGVTISVGAANQGLAITESTSSNGGTITLALDNDVAAIEALVSTGFLVRTSTNVWAQRSLVAGSGISISNTSGLGGNPTITNTGDTDASDDITTSTSAGGDLTGTYPNPTININKVDSTKVINFGLSVLDLGVNGATAGQVLKFNGTQWAPGNDSIGVGGSSITYSTTAPTDTLTTWVYTGATVLKIWEVRKYINGAWRTFEWYDRVANFASPQPPLFVLATGQSNMLGNGTPQTDTTYDYRVSVWDSTLVKWKTAIVGSYPITGNSPAFHFSKTAAKAENRIVRLILLAQSSQSIVKWSPNGGGPMWNNLIQRLNASGTQNIDVVLWHQGEADALMADQTYIDSFTVIRNAIALNSKIGPNKMIMVGGLTPDPLTYKSTALITLSQKFNNVKFVDVSYLTYFGAHFLETQYPELGKRYYQYWKGKDIPTFNALSRYVFTDRNVLIGYVPGEMVTPYELSLKGRLSVQTATGFNQVMGFDALKNCTTCQVNTALSNKNLLSCTTCVGNTVGGIESAWNVVNGNNNTIWGGSAAQSLVSGSGNYIFANNTLTKCVSGNDNGAFGPFALEYNLGSSNLANGKQTLRFQTNQSGNAAGGERSGYFNTTGTLSAWGPYSAYYNGRTTSNTALGTNANSTWVTGTTFTVSAVDPTTDIVTFSAPHGYSVGVQIPMKFIVLSGTAPGGIVNTEVLVVESTGTSTVKTIYNNLTSAGAGSFTFESNVEVSNTTSLGYNSMPNASNQVVLGNTNVTQLLSTGGLYLSNSSNTNYLAGSVGIGVVPTAKLHISTGVSNTTAIQRLQNTSGDIDLFTTSGTPESVVTGNVGDIAYNVAGAPYYKKTGSGNTGWKTLDPQSITLDEAYNNFGATASKITIDAAESQTGGLVIESTTADNFIVNLASTGDFNIQDNGSQFAQFGDNGNVGFGINAQSSNKLTVQQSASGTQIAEVLRNGVDEDGQGIGLDFNNAGIVHGRIVATNPAGSLTSALDLMTPDNSGTLSSFHTMQRDGSQNQLHKAIYYDVYSGTSTTETLTGLVTLVNIPSTATTTTINLPEIVSGVPAANQVNIGYILELSIENASAITIQRSGSSDVIMVDGATSTVTSVATTGGTYYVKRYIAVELNKWIVF